MDDREIRNRIVAKMLRKRVIGNKKQQVDTVVGYAVPTHAEGRAKDLVDELVRDGVIEQYGGGHRSNIRLRSAERAIEYLNDNDGDVPFPFG